MSDIEETKKKIKKKDTKQEIVEVTKESNNVEVNEGIKSESKLKTFFKTNKKGVIYSCIAVAIILILLIFSTFFSLININNTKIISKVKINGIDFGSLSKEEANQKLNEIIVEKLEGDILIKSNDFEYGIKLSQIETSYNVEKAIEEAYNVGRNGNIFSNNYEILSTMMTGKNIELEYTYNEELLNKKIDDMKSKVPEPVTEPSYNIEDEDKLIITRGKAGNSIDEEQVKQKIIDEILNNNPNNEISIDLIKEDPEDIDIDKIYSEVHTEPKDAYYTKDPFQVFPHVNGVDFDLETAREMLKEEKEEYEIDLKITVPKVTISQIGSEAFPDRLSTFTTKYNAANAPRTNNLRLAMNKLNGYVVAPGETFSYNKAVGKRTVEGGYQEAGGYAGGRVVQTLAGGICQSSSTLYNAVVYANLDVVERYNHMFLAGYVGAGRDATVVYGSLDFKFKNTRKYPIMIKTSIGGGVATVSIYGVKEDVEYDVDIVTNVLSYTPFKVIYETDKSLAEGQEKVTQNGMNGCKSITYKVLKLNGSEVSRTVLSSDTYDPMNKIISTGPKNTATTQTSSNTNNNKQKTTTTNNNTNNKSNNNTSNNSSSKPSTNTSNNTNTNTNTNSNTNAQTNSTNESTTNNQTVNNTTP